MHYTNAHKVIHKLRVHFARIVCFQRFSQGGFGGDTGPELKCARWVWVTLCSMDTLLLKQLQIVVLRFP